MHALGLTAHGKFDFEWRGFATGEEHKVWPEFIFGTGQARGVVLDVLGNRQPLRQGSFAVHALGRWFPFPGFVLEGDKAVAVFLKQDRKSTRLNSSHVRISYAVFCLKKKNKSYI